MEEQLNIDIDKPISLPSNISIKTLSSDRILIIDSNTPNWITLKSEIELKIFERIYKGDTIDSILNDSCLSDIKNIKQELSNVLIEIYNNEFISKNKSVVNENNYNLTLYLTDNCNLNCIHCYRYKKNSKLELTTQQWKGVINQFSKLKNRGDFVTFTGGEATLRKDFLELLKYSYSLGLKNIILTNATYLKLDKYEEVVKYAHEVQISLDGINLRQNDKVRGTGTYKKITTTLKYVANLSNQINKNLRIALAMTFMPEDLVDIESNIKTFTETINKELERNIIYRVSTRLKPGRTIKELDIVSQVQYKKATTRIKNIIYNDDFWASKLYYASNFSPFIKIINCGFGQNIGILANGNVMACSESSGEFIGNATNMTMEQIQNKLYNIFSETSIYKMETCNKCDLKFLCGGGCRIDNMKFSGSYLKPSICKTDINFKKYIYNIMADRREFSWNY